MFQGRKLAVGFFQVKNDARGHDGSKQIVIVDIRKGKKKRSMHIVTTALDKWKVLRLSTLTDRVRFVTSLTIFSGLFDGPLLNDFLQCGEIRPSTERDRPFLFLIAWLRA